MHKNPVIYAELKEIGSQLADWPVVNVFQVPPGFFETFPAQVNAFRDVHEFPELIQSMDVPAGYFDGLATSIMDKIRLEEKDLETANEPSLNNIPDNRNVFTVPAGYFADLPALILAKVRNEDNALMIAPDPSLSAFPGNRNVFTVPFGYFESLSGSIVDKIFSVDGIDEVSTVLPANTNVFKVPSGYFEGLHSQILSTVATPQVKVVAMPRRSVFRYAIAAALTGLLGLSLFSVFNNKEQTNLSNSTSTIIADANKIIQSNSFDAEMTNLDENAIVSFLEAEGEDVQAALVASVATEQNMPDEDQYFFDEKTLDNFLNENQITNSTN